MAAPPAHPSYGGDGEICGEFGAGGLSPPERREVYDGGRIVDITHRFGEDMPSFGTSEGLGQFLWLPQSIKNGSNCNVSLMKLIVHSGTHVDAPGHFFQEYFEAGYDVDTLDLAVLNGTGDNFFRFISSLLLFALLYCLSNNCSSAAVMKIEISDLAVCMDCHVCTDLAADIFCLHGLPC